MLGTRNHSGDLVHYLPCEECGSLVIDEAQLHQWRWDSKVLTSAVSSLICPGQQVVELVADQVWVLGKLTLSAVRPQLVLFRSAKAVQLDQVVQWQLTNKSVIGLFPFDDISKEWKGDSFDLAKAIQVDDHGIKLTDQWHAFLDTKVNSEKGPSRVPRKRRSERALNIEKITKYLTEFLLQRADHAQATFEATGQSELLEPPKQKKIAEDLKLSEAAVSKCLNDPAAVALRVYWEHCQSQDLNSCYRYREQSSVSYSQVMSQQNSLIDNMRG